MVFFGLYLFGGEVREARTTPEFGVFVLLQPRLAKAFCCSTRHLAATVDQHCFQGRGNVLLRLGESRF